MKILLLILFPAILFAQDTTKMGVPLIKGRTSFKTTVAETTITGRNVNVGTALSNNADSTAAVNIRVDRIGIQVKDYNVLGNGSTNDSAGIASAISALPSTGGKLIFPNGIFYTGQINLNKPVEMVGNGMATVIVARNNLNTSLLVISSDSVTVRDLVIDGNRANQSPLVGSGNYDGLFFTHGVNILPPRREVRIENVVIRNAYNNGIYAHGYQGTTPDSTVRGLVLKNNKIYDVGFDCVFIRATWDVQIHGNRLQSWGQLDTNSDGIRVWEGTHNFSVQNNLFKPTVSRFFGIEMTVANAGDTTRGVNLSDNTAEGLYTGFSGHFGTGAVISGNEFHGGYGNWRSGLELVGQQMTVTGNTIRNGSIAASGSKNMNISTNTISTNLTSGFGIALGTAGGTPDSGYSLVGNIIDVSKATNAFGIYLGTYGAVGVIHDMNLIGNQIQGNSTSTGIRLRAATPSRNIFLALNVVRRCGTGFFFDSTGTNGYVEAFHNDLRGNATPLLQSDGIGIYDLRENFLFDLTTSSGGGSSFSPHEISGLNLWLRAQYGYAGYIEGTINPSMEDSSGNGRLFENNTSVAIYRTNRINGYPIIEMTSGDSFLRTGGTAITDTNFTLMIVAKTSGTDEFALTSTDFASAAMLGSGGLNKMAFTDTTGHTVLSDVLLRPRTEFCIYEWRRSGTSIKFYQDGVLLGSGTVGLNAFRAAKIDGMTGDFAELLLWNSALSDSLRFLVENYLNDKYLLTENTLGNEIVTGVLRVDSLVARSGGWGGGTQDSTGTGKMVRQDSPTFTTQVINPLMIGGTGTTSTLTLQSTSGSGTTGSDIIFKDNNTEFGRFTNDATLKLQQSITVQNGTSTFDGNLYANPTNSSIYIANSGSATSYMRLWGSTSSTTPDVTQFVNNAATTMTISKTGLVNIPDSLTANTISATNLLSGTYTPTPVNTTNVAASTAYVTGYYRVGNSVTVYGKVDIDVTLAASTATELQIDLPIASNLAGEEDLAGDATGDAVASLVVRIKGDLTSDKASFVFKALSLTNDSYSFKFSYQVK